jgi:phage terminase large subunit
MELIVHSEIFNEVYKKYLDDQTPLQILYGGSSSGKSHFLAQRVVLDVLRYPRNYLIVRNIANTLRSSVFNQVVETIESFGVARAFQVNLSDLSITYLPTRQQMLFRGLDDPEKLKSIKPKKGIITDIWVEEATEISEPAFNQLLLRLRGRAPVPKRVTFSFNPISRLHWICKRFFNGQDIEGEKRTDKVAILKTTYKDNEFLDKEDIERIESFKHTDPFYFNVYGLGKWGTLGDLIFKNWDTEDLSTIDFPLYKHGLDFGYAADPFAYTKSARGTGTGRYNGRNTIYVTKEIYEHGCTNDIIAAKIEPYCGKEIVWCDSAEPKSIAELRQYKINAHPGKKRRLFGGLAQGKGSAVLFRIQWMQQQRWIIDKSCQYTINEFSTYQWQKDRFGNTLPVPVDRDNHSVDSLGYAWENDMISLKPMMITSRDLEEREDKKQAETTTSALDKMIMGR